MKKLIRGLFLLTISIIGLISIIGFTVGVINAFQGDWRAFGLGILVYLIGAILIFLMASMQRRREHVWSKAKEQFRNERNQKLKEE